MTRAFAILCLVAGAAHAQVGSVSPGLLARPHAAFEAQCNRCHVPFAGIPNALCLTCHAALADKVARGVGLHATVKDRACVECHHEHHGRDAAISPPVPRSFDHRTAAFPADGRHATLACERCHPANGASRRWVGIGTQCASCHADKAHRGGFGSACEKCHTSAGWTPTIRTEKNHLTPIAGGHASLTCADCHNAGLHLAPQQSCGLCHAQKHGGTKVECSVCHTVMGWKQVTYTHDFCPCKLPGKHQTAPCLSCHPAFRFHPTPFECAACHDKERRHEPLGACSQCHSSLSWKTKAFDHDRKRVGFPLTGKHLLLGCENCHTVHDKFKGLSRTCEGCHAVPAHGDFGPCATCHTTAGWTPTSFDHGRTRMPLDGKHAQLKCQECHPAKTAGYQPGPGACQRCHADPHAGQFQKPAPTPSPALMQMPPMHAVGANRACSDCHTTDRWKPSTVTAANHANFGFALADLAGLDPSQLAKTANTADFGYALVGKHATTDCNACHLAGRYAGTTRACNGCHTDVRHHGRFGTHCDECHTPAGWRPVASFDHARTGFGLDNAHAKLGCAACHGASGTKLVGVPRAGACETCHAPPHGQQFGSRCTQCHTTASFTKVPPFDHDRTDFPLELRHAAVPCLQCHDAKQRPVVNRACRTCHGDPHRGANSFDCTDCHRADRWRIIRFDHDLTSYPLVGRHRITSCGGCHNNPTWTGVRSDCVACHAFDRPRTQDHMTRVECDDCHTPIDWRDVRNL